MAKLITLGIVLSIIVLTSARATRKPRKSKPCTTDMGTEGKCVGLALCNNGTIITNGAGMLDPRFGADIDITNSVDSQCDHYLEECCSLEKIHTNNTIKPKREVGECGKRNRDGVGFTITEEDREAQYGEFPWMVGILQQFSSKESYLCGGSLIAENVVLTAAHCLNESNLNNLIIRAGEYDTQTTFELFPHVDYKVQNVVIHEDFYRGALLNDIALLFLDTKVNMTETVSTICLPSQDQDYDSENCVATGWGKNRFGSKELLQTILKKVELPTVPFDDCEDKLRDTRLGEDFTLNESFMCAGGEEGIDTCKGDGGSPLVCPIDGKTDQYYQVGIVAWGIECGKKDVPGVYVNVAKYRGWIDKQMKV